MRKLFFVLLLTGTFGCAGKKAKMPAGLLEPGQLTSILADIHILESRVEAMQLHPDTAQVYFKRRQEDVFKKHGISKKQFDRTYDYYLEDLVNLDKIYEALVDTLSMREINLASTVKPETAVKPDTTVKPDTGITERRKGKDPRFSK